MVPRHAALVTLSVSSAIQSRYRQWPGLCVAAVYLAVTLPLLATLTGHVGAVAMHIALVIVAVELVRRDSSRWDVVRDWGPLVLMAALYAELPALIAAVGRPLSDSTVINLEARTFGGQPALTLASHFPGALWSNVLHLAYLSYYPLIFVPPALLYVRGRRPEFRRTVFALVLVFAACFLMFINFPVQGPRYEWIPRAARADEPVRAIALRILAAGSSRGTAFPSSHIAVSAVQTICALYFQPLVGVVALILTVGIGVGAVYGGFHYGVDMIGGAVVGICVAVLALRASRTIPVVAIDAMEVPAPIPAAVLDHAEELSGSRATNAS